MKFVISLTLSIILLLSISLSISQSGIALIRQQEEAPGQLLYQSRHSLSDETGSTWQVVLFKRVQDGEVKTIELRLVGFPGRASFVHPKILQIIISDGIVLKTQDQFAEQAPAPNVGQYDFKKILSQLPTNKGVRLILPLEKERSLFVPSPVLLEWRFFAQS
ncbi:DUF3122 domain-containing protein [Gloeothece verrucosa]|nr:DUF3122 domain-containing protein [Gloeothece verrucosa]